MRICKDGRVWGQNNKEAEKHLGILTGHKKWIKKGYNLNSAFPKHHTGEWIKAHSGKNSFFYGMTGKDSFRHGKTPPHGKGAYYKGIWMRSPWEINIAKWLDKQNWKWLYESKRFELKDRTYCPDFYLPDLNVWWEIKGWFNKRAQETIKQFRELYPYEKLVVATKKIYEEILHC